MLNLNRFFMPALLLASSLSMPALALDGKEILVKVEQTINAPKDRVAIVKMIIKSKDGTVKERKMKTTQKGVDKKLFTFLAPADLKGVGFLVIDDDTLYLYSPAFGKIRRIASHIKNENFMATDFSYNDLAENDFSADYEATLNKEDEKNFILTLIPKDGVQTDYSKLEMWVDKTTWLPNKTNMYDKHGKLLKTLSNTKVKKVDNYWIPTVVSMTNVQKEHSTVMKLMKVQHDKGLSNKIFTKRQLKKAI